MGVKISKRYSSYKSQPNVFKLVLNFLPNGPHKIALGIFQIWGFWILMIFFQTFKLTIVAYGEIKSSIIWTNERFVEQNGAKFGIRGYSNSTYIGYLCLCSVQCPFGVIQCICDFPKNTIKKKTTLLLLQITAEIYQLLLNYLLNGPHKTTFGIFETLKIEKF